MVGVDRTDLFVITMMMARPWLSFSVILVVISALIVIGKILFSVILVVISALVVISVRLGIKSA